MNKIRLVSVMAASFLLVSLASPAVYAETPQSSPPSTEPSSEVITQSYESYFPANTTSVSNEVQLRNSFMDPNVTVIQLTENISLSNCDEMNNGGVFKRISGAPVTVDGQGFAVLVECAPQASQMPLESTEGEGSGIFVSTSGEKLTLMNITLTGGSAQHEEGPAVWETGGGGAVYSSGDVEVIESTFQNNSALAGGAILSEGFVEVTSSSFVENEALDSSGGAILAANGVAIIETAFVNNFAFHGGGAVASNSPATFNSVDFLQNEALAFGGAVLVTGGDSQDEFELTTQSVTITNSTFTENNTSSILNSNGGAVYLARAATFIGNSFFTNNSSSNLGGAVFMLGASGVTGSDIPAPVESPLWVEDTTFQENSAIGNSDSGGGAISAPLIEVVDSIFSSNETDGSGGAIYTEKITVEKSTFVSNQAGLDGGAISSLSETLLKESSIEENVAGTGGGGVSQGGKAIGVSQTTVKDNKALGGFGGGIRTYNAATALVSGSIIEGNEAAQQGGGISLNGGGTIENSSLTNNKADRGGGASGVNVTVQTSTFAGNTSTDFGGGVFLSSTPDSTSIVRTSTFNNNAAESGGGVAFASNSSGRIFNSTITNNEATGFGGGVVTGGGSSTGTFQLSFVTIADNSAPSGKELAVSRPATLQGVIVSSNTSGSCSSSPENLSASYSYFSDGSCVPATGTNTVNAGMAPLGALTNNGGYTLTKLPNEGSVLVNFIPSAQCETFLEFAFDQRGVQRPLNDACDIGAVEAGDGPGPGPGPGPNPDPPTPAPTVICTAGPSTPPLTSYQGEGSTELTASIPNLPILLGFNHEGEGIFKVVTLNESRQQIAVLVDTTGPYVGTLPIQFNSTDTSNPMDVKVKYIEVTADDDSTWDVQAWLATDAPEVTSSEINGACDTVILMKVLESGNQSVDVTNTGDGELSVFAYTKEGTSSVRLFSADGPATQTTQLVRPHPLVVVSSNAEWSVTTTPGTPSGGGSGSDTVITESQEPRFTG